MERDFEALSETISSYAGKKEFFSTDSIKYFSAGFAVVFRPDGNGDIVPGAFRDNYCLRVCGMAENWFPGFGLAGVFHWAAAD